MEPALGFPVFALLKRLRGRFRAGTVVRRGKLPGRVLRRLIPIRQRRRGVGEMRVRRRVQNSQRAFVAGQLLFGIGKQVDPSAE